MRNTRILLIALALTLVTGAVFSQSSTSGNQRAFPAFQVTVVSNVRNASVYINGELQRGTTPLTVTLRRGTYDIRVEARGYLPWTRTVSIYSDSSLTADLRPAYATVVLGVPSQYLNYDVRNPLSLVSFYLDGQLRRESRIQLEPGWHDVAIASGGLRLEGEVFLESGLTYTLELILRLSMLQTIQTGR